MEAAGVSISQVIQFSMSAVLTIGMAICGWFVSKIFEEIKQSRSNERDLYKTQADTRESVLKLHIEFLRDQLGVSRNKERE
jgi:hypothetical protein